MVTFLPEENKANSKQNENTASQAQQRTDAFPPMPPGLIKKTIPYANQPALQKTDDFSTKKYARGPMFISLDRFNSLREEIITLKKDLEILHETVQNLKQNKSASSELLHLIAERIEVMDARVESINSVVRT